MSGARTVNVNLGQVRQNSAGVLGALASGLTGILPSSDLKSLAGLPSVTAGVIGAVMQAADLEGTIEWSPTASALLPDVLPVPGAVMYYNGARQLGSGGAASHAGSLTLGGALTATKDGLSCEVDPVNWRFRLSTVGLARMDLDQYSLRFVDSAMILWSNVGNNANAVKLLGLAKNSTTHALQINTGVRDVLAGLECSTVNFGTSAAYLAQQTAGLVGAGFGGSSMHVGIGGVSGEIRMTAGTVLGFSSHGLNFGSAAADTNATRASAGVWQLGTGNTANALGSLLLGNLTASGDVILTGVANGLRLNAGGTSRGLVYFSSGQNRLNSTGAIPWVIESNSGLAVRNTANSADAPLTAGAITASGNITTTGQITAGSGGNGFQITGSGYILGGGNGVIYLQDMSASTFNRLCFGSVDASAPALKRSGTTLSVRLANDSADAPLTAGAITATGAGPTLYINRSGMSSFSLGDANGDTFRIQNAGDTSDMLRIHGSTKAATFYGAITANGGITVPTNQLVTFTDHFGSPISLTIPTNVAGALRFRSQFSGYGELRPGGNGSPSFVGSPSLSIASVSATGFIGFGFGLDAGYSGGYFTLRPSGIASGGGARFRNGGDTADAPISCGAITASGPIGFTPQQSTLDPTTTDVPSGRRVSWYNSTVGEFRDWVNIGGVLLKSAAYT